MPIPSGGGGESKDKFMSRCISDSVMKKEYPDIKQRIAVCMSKYDDESDARDAKDGKYKGKPPKSPKKKKASKKN
jgi:hypothetical protein|tara:strand:+ start:990 stop:1214 length:225 start_codon:yes stop_codon:yes gene_type:complete